MPQIYKETVANTVFENTEIDHHFFDRLYAFTPFYICRWSLIMLNDFLPHRQLIANNSDSYENLKRGQLAQLTKVRDYLIFQNNNSPSCLPLE